MDYIERLFKLHPFIYFINGKYYVFGAYVCTECDMKSVLLERKYKTYEDSLDEKLTKEEAWKIFHAVMFEAEREQENNGYCTEAEAKKKFSKLKFSNAEMDELKAQIERYFMYWNKYSLYERIR